MVAVAVARCRKSRPRLVGTLCVVLLAGGCSWGSDDVVPTVEASGTPGTSATAGAGSTSASPSRTATPPDTGPSPAGTPSRAGTPSGRLSPSLPVPPERPAVAPRRTATASDRVSVSLSRIEAVQGVAYAPGEIAGPALRVTVRLVNNGSTSLDLGLVAVNAYVGKDRVPAGTVTKPGGKPLSGELAKGRSADGVYLFVVPTTQRQDVTVTVDYRADVPTAVFRGPMP